MLAPDPQAGAGLPQLERLWLDNPAGRVEAWLLPGVGASSDRPGPALVFAHGNNELIEHWPGLLDPLRQLGLTILLPEYRGYGRSGGKPSERGILDDFVRFYELLVARPEVDAQRVAFYGRSLGGGVVCGLAALRRPAALILTSTFTSIRAMAARYWLPGALVRDPFDNLETVRRLDVPILIGHGTRDRLIPVEQARQLAAAAPRAELLLEPAEHGDFPPDWPAFVAHVDEFLRRAKVLRRD